MCTPTMCSMWIYTKNKTFKVCYAIKKRKSKIIDVAFDLGFCSVDGYTRAFYKEFGMTPTFKFCKFAFIGQDPDGVLTLFYLLPVLCRR